MPTVDLARKLEDHEHERARANVARHATSREDYAELISMLGLDLPAA